MNSGFNGFPSIVPRRIASYKADAQITIAQSAAETRLQFNQKVVDDDNAVIVGANWTFIAPVMGIYTFSWSLGVQVSNEFWSYGYKNGVSTRTVEKSSTGTWNCLNAVWIVKLDKDDKIYFTGSCNGTTAGSVYAWMWFDALYG